MIYAQSDRKIYRSTQICVDSLPTVSFTSQRNLRKARIHMRELLYPILL